MKKVFKTMMTLFVLISFLALPAISLAEEYTAGEEVKKEEMKKKEASEKDKKKEEKKKEEAKKEEEIKEEKKAVEIEDMTVTATRTKSDVENLPQNVTVIDSKEIDERHTKTLDDILNMQAGIDIIRSYGLGYSGWVIMRGVGSYKRTLILEDGIPMNNIQYGSFSGWNAMQVGDVANVEVIRGPSSALYGSNAMGGVINIMTKEPTEKMEGDISYTYGSQNTHLYELNVRGKPKDWLGLRLAAGGKNNDGYKHIIPWLDYYKPTTMDQYNIAPGINLQLGDSVLKLDYEHLNEDSMWTTYSTYDGKNRLDKYTLRYDLPIGNIDIDARAYYIDRSHKTNSNLYNSATQSHDTPYYFGNIPEKDWGTLIQATGELWGQRFTAGYDFKWGEVTSDTDYYTSSGLRHYAGKQLQHSPFVNGEFSLGEKTVLTLGLRYDKWENFDADFLDSTSDNVLKTNYADRTDDHWSPSAGVVYRLFDNTRVRASFGTGFRAPALYSLYSASVYGTTLYLGNPDLKPETMPYSADCGVDIRFPMNINFGVTYYQSRIKDFIGRITVGKDQLPSYIDPASVSTIYKNENIGKVDIHGVEASITTAFSALYGDWNLGLNYTFNNSEIESCKDPSLVGKVLDYNQPRHMANLSINYDNPILFTVNLSLRYRSSVYCDSENTDEKPTYVVGDIKLSRRLPFLDGATLFLSVTNFANKTYMQCPQCPDYVMPGREYYLGLKYVF